MITIEDFHRSRRMFAVINNVLFISEPNTTESHKEWFIRMNWIKDDKDTYFNIIPRGYVDSKNLYIYIGENFEEDIELAEVLLQYLPQLINKLQLSNDINLCLGAIPGGNQNPFPPRRVLGKIKDFF